MRNVLVFFGVDGGEWDIVSLALAAKNPAAPSHPAYGLFFFKPHNCDEAKQNAHCHKDNSTTSYFSVS